MKKPWMPIALVAVIVVCLAVIGGVAMQSMDSGGARWTDDERKLADAIDNTGGDLSKLSPEMRKLYDEQVRNSKGGTIATYAKGKAGSPYGGAPPSSTSMGAPTPKQKAAAGEGN